jgi:hypothetical protein
MLDNNFCKDLLDDPYNTDVAFGPDGFLITLTKPQIPAPHVMIGPMRAEFVSNSVEQVISLTDKIVKELIRLKVSPLELSAVGVNTEHEFLGIEQTAQEYLASKFLVSGFKTEKHLFLNMTDIRFQVKGNEDVSYNLCIQPRANQLNGIYININTHRQVIGSVTPRVDYLNDLYKQTDEELKNLIFPSLDLEG